MIKVRKMPLVISCTQKATSHTTACQTYTLFDTVIWPRFCVNISNICQPYCWIVVKRALNEIESSKMWRAHIYLQTIQPSDASWFWAENWQSIQHRRITEKEREKYNSQVKKCAWIHVQIYLQTRCNTWFCSNFGVHFLHVFDWLRSKACWWHNSLISMWTQFAFVASVTKKSHKCEH